jgi:hypothetical protein
MSAYDPKGRWRRDFAVMHNRYPCCAEILESRFLISCRMNGLSNMIDRQIGHALR